MSAELDDLLKKMASGGKNWNTPAHFARSATRLGLRDYGFPSELVARAHVDGFGDLGLDGVGIAIDDTPILESADVAEALAVPAASRVLRIFMLQAKRKDIIMEADAILFGSAAQKFLTLGHDDIKRLKPNPDALAQWECYDAVRKADPALAAQAHVTLLFAYRGDWRDFNTVNTARTQSETNIRNALPQVRVEFVVWGDEAIIAAGRRVGPEFKKRLSGVKLLPLPPGAAEGYLGYVTGQGLVDLVSRKAGGKLQAQDFFFFDNVRAFIGTNNDRNNPGAFALDKTIAGGKAARVLLCHNGVVIVASGGQLTASGDAIELSSPQIVNGCQSTNVLVNNAAKLGDCHVPIKIVITEDEDLKDAIVLASNTQAAVDDYDMLARNQGLRDLQTVFDRGEAQLHERIWLQRRRDEPIDWPEHWTNRDWARVMRPRHLLDAYAAAIRAMPHTAHDKPGKILELAQSGEAFGDEHEPTMYRALGWMVVTGRRWARRHNRKWQDLYTHSGPGSYPARHQFIHALWRIADAQPDAIAAPHIAKSGAADQRFQLLIKTLIDHGDALGDAAGEALEAAGKAKGGLNRDLATRLYFTTAVAEAADAARPAIRAKCRI